MASSSSERDSPRPPRYSGAFEQLRNEISCASVRWGQCQGVLRHYYLSLSSKRDCSCQPHHSKTFGQLMTKKRCSDKCLIYFSLGAVILWFGLSISFIAVLEKKLVEVKHENYEYNEKLKESVAASELKRRRRQGDELPQYPINHRHLNNVTHLLSDQAIDQCHKALWHTVDTTAYVLPNNESFVITGDINNLWLRDSAAQIHPLLLPNTYNGQSLVQVDQKLERIVSGLILKTARLIRFDPYANAFRLKERSRVTKFERKVLGRHGYIATWNYELDSACYFLRMLFFFHESFPNHPVLKEREVKEAVSIIMDVWIAEQRHEEDAYPRGELFDCVHCGKPYRYNPAELKRNGKGTMTNSSAGLTWTGFRPSDDPCVYGYLIPANMFAVVTLGYVAKLAAVVWDDESMVKKARKLRQEIDDGIQQYGIVEHPTHGRIYAYEVDGLGNYLLMDDANVPSLLSIPYLGYDYDPTIFVNTKRFLFSKDNPMFHEGKHDGVPYAGIGSPHTKFIASSIWPMAMIMEGLVSNNATHKVVLVEKLLASSAGTGWMHESFNPNNPAKFSRPWFCWPDSLFAELVMSLTEACPRPEGGGYSIKEWTDRDNAAHVVRGSVFMKPTLSPTPHPTTPMAQPLPQLSLDDAAQVVRGSSDTKPTLSPTPPLPTPVPHPLTQLSHDDAAQVVRGSVFTKATLPPTSRPTTPMPQPLSQLSLDDAAQVVRGSSDTKPTLSPTPRPTTSMPQPLPQLSLDDAAQVVRGSVFTKPTLSPTPRPTTPMPHPLSQLSLDDAAQVVRGSVFTEPTLFPTPRPTTSMPQPLTQLSHDDAVQAVRGSSVTKPTLSPTPRPTTPMPQPLPQLSHDDAAQVVRGSLFAKPTLSPTPPPTTPMPQPSLAVVSECIRGVEGVRDGRYVDASFSNKRSFCEKWNATCVLSDMSHVDGDDDGMNPFVAKWQLINRTLHETHADWIMWLDCDAAFTNLDIDWRHLLSSQLDNSTALLASRDKNGVNLGVLLMSKSRGISFVSIFQEWLLAKEDDQAALKDVMERQQPVQRYIDDMVPQEKIDSYIHNPDGHKWELNEWIVHQVWCKNTQKCASRFLLILKDVAERISNAD